MTAHVQYIVTCWTGREGFGSPITRHPPGLSVAARWVYELVFALRVDVVLPYETWL